MLGHFGFSFSGNFMVSGLGPGPGTDTSPGPGPDCSIKRPSHLHLVLG